MTTANKELRHSVETAQENTSDADPVAPQAGDPAERDGGDAEKPIAAQNLIEATSAQVSQITRMISEIAGQTDLLAAECRDRGRPGRRARHGFRRCSR